MRGVVYTNPGAGAWSRDLAQLDNRRRELDTRDERSDPARAEPHLAGQDHLAHRDTVIAARLVRP
jgi:hypothetical protein